ncbi:uncharacterized protein LOC141699273 [Apium graveolens]|uniref:uncharacterized protein LOC141699273 n=1 Tax=Apium graveolens TaxID=4045 RepID=UPI003D7AA1D3
MERIMNKFWWKGSNGGKGIRWLQWDRMCTKKSSGGMGFRKLQDFNVVLLGTTVSITQDPWLPSSDPYIHTDHEAIRNRTVDALMITNQIEWDVDLVKDIFSERDAQLILSIPLRPSDMDSWFWKWENLSHYSVKSAYAAIQETKQNSCWNDNFPWKRVWNLKVPLKVKHFIWRAIRNILPTKDQLLSRRVAVIDKCPICNLEVESVYHSLVSCQFAKQCWCLLGISPVEDDQSSFNNWLSAMIQKCINRKLQEVVMVCWSMWHNRNEIVWNQRGGEGSEVCRSAKALLNQWQNAQDKSFDNFLDFMNQEDDKERWEQPQEGTVKINVDAAIFENFNTYCWSMVA